MQCGDPADQEIDHDRDWDRNWSAVRVALHGSTAMQLPSGDYYAWVACESLTAKALRRQLIADHGAIAEFERELIRARTGEGRKRAQALAGYRDLSYALSRKARPSPRDEA
jgi:hypothetical protein